MPRDPPVTVAAFPPMDGAVIVLWHRHGPARSPGERPGVLPLVRDGATWRVPLREISGGGGLMGISMNCGDADAPKHPPPAGDPQAVVDSFVTAVEAQAWDQAVDFLMWEMLDQELARNIRWARVGSEDRPTIEPYYGPPPTCQGRPRNGWSSPRRPTPVAWRESNGSLTNTPAWTPWNSSSA